MHKGKSAFSPTIPRAFQVTQETGAPRAELIRGSWAKRPLDWKIKKISPSYNAKTGLGSDGNKACGFPWERALQLRPLWDAFPFVFRPTRWNAPTSFLLARQTAPPQNAQRSSDGGRGLCCAPCGRARRGDAFPLFSASSAGLRQRYFLLARRGT